MSRSVPQKLLIRPGSDVWVSHPDRVALLGGLPEGVRLLDEPTGAQVMIVFVDDARSAGELLEVHRKQLPHVPVLWFAYPKGGRTDVNRDSLWPMVAEYGLRPITQIAIDETWSALRFRPLQDGETGFSPGAGSRRPKT